MSVEWHPTSELTEQAQDGLPVLLWNTANGEPEIGAWSLDGGWIVVGRTALVDPSEYSHFAIIWAPGHFERVAAARSHGASKR